MIMQNCFHPQKKKKKKWKSHSGDGNLLLGEVMAARNLHEQLTLVKT